MLYALTLTPTRLADADAGADADAAEWDLAHKLRFANELAGRKVRREGFEGLGREMRRAL